ERFPTIWARLLRRALGGSLARRRGDRQNLERPQRLGEISRTVRKKSGQLYQKTLERRVFPLRHGKRIPRQHPGRPTRRTVVRAHDRSRRSRPDGHTTQGTEEDFRL